MREASLHGYVLAAAAAHPERPAMEVDGETLSYAQLRERATSLAAGLMAHAAQRDAGPRLTAALVGRSAAGFSGILGALCSGHGYVPMVPGLPAARLRLMITRSEARTLLLDAEGEAGLDEHGGFDEFLDSLEQPMLVVLLEAEVDDARRARHPRHTLVGRDELPPAAQWSRPRVVPEDIAYLLFTSGSTGEPKGVMVAHRNITRFLDVVIERYELGPEDRFSHLFEITFDLSLFDLFAPWSVGGCLCVPDKRDRMLPARYVAKAGLSVYFSVPSAALLMKQLRALTPDAFPELRLALFCGEALPLAVAESFAAAAPAAVLENIYGPTELTLACTTYRIGAHTAGECENEVVPIGEPFPGMRAKIVDAQLAEVAPGESGELIMAGPQRALGYWRDPQKTAAAFMVPPGETERFYRTGDRVRRPAQAGAPMTFLGRMDTQVKIKGYRVELGEIEAAICREAGVAAAVAVAWPKTPAGASGVVAFVAPGAARVRAGDIDVDGILDALEVSLPRYMVPSDLHVLEAFPLNQNGKIDRRALLARLREEED
nr:amino acid adenylation domain-containing protein [Pseudenhygromyxa sp. WMMC2535]